MKHFILVIFSISQTYFKYKIIDMQLTHKEAQNWCSLLNGTLPMPKSKSDELRLLESMKYFSDDGAIWLSGRNPIFNILIRKTWNSFNFLDSKANFENFLKIIKLWEKLQFPKSNKIVNTIFEFFFADLLRNSNLNSRKTEIL